MAADTTYAPVEEAGNGVKVAFDFAFKILAKTDLVVRKKSAAGVYGSVLTVDVDYTVVFDSVAETGTVTYTVAPVNGGASNIQRSSDLTQATVYPREGTLPAKTTETALDKLTLLVQEIYYWLNKRVPAYAAQPSNPAKLIITTPTDRRAMIYATNGDGTYNIVPSTYDPDENVAAAAASAAAAAASATAAASSATAAAASATAAAASATTASTIAAALQLSGLYSARPVAPTVTTIYYSTDRDSAELWLPAANRWFLLG